jgi:hypothetical protein
MCSIERVHDTHIPASQNHFNTRAILRHPRLFSLAQSHVNRTKVPGIRHQRPHTVSDLSRLKQASYLEVTLPSRPTPFVDPQPASTHHQHHPRAVVSIYYSPPPVALRLLFRYSSINQEYTDAPRSPRHTLPL